MTPQLEAAMHGAINALLAKQQPDGHWVFGLEADAAMTAELSAAASLAVCWLWQQRV